MSLRADSLLLAASFGVFGFKLGKTVLLGLFGSLFGQFSCNLGVWVKSLHEGLVLQWVLLSSASENWVRLNVSKFSLNLVRVDNSGKISACHHASVEGVASLLNSLLSVGTKDLVEVLEGISSEDNESAEVTTWGELK